MTRGEARNDRLFLLEDSFHEIIVSISPNLLVNGIFLFDHMVTENNLKLFGTC